MNIMEVGMHGEIRQKEDVVARITTLAVIIPLICALAGCSRSSTAAKGPPPAPEVLVARVQQRDVPIYNEWIGTLDGLVNADIKAQVSGYLEKQEYTEGSFVKRGELLFEIDPR